MIARILTIGRRTVPSAAVAAAASLILFVAPASAKTHTFTVKSKSDLFHGGACASKCTLRDAVVAADNVGGASTIKVPAGTYKLSIKATNTGANPLDDPKVGDLDINSGVHLTILGAGSSKTILNAAHLDRMFAVHLSASLAVSGVTVENGEESENHPSAYGISSGSGGAFYNAGVLKITKSVLTRNVAYDDGGAIYTDSGATSTSIIDSTVTSNVADYPAGVLYAQAGSINLTGDTIEDNFGSGDGGVLYADGTGKITVAHTKVEYNASDGDAGAMDLQGTGPISISDSTVSHNAANGADKGGALNLQGTGRLTVSRSTFAGNTADQGGAISFEGANVTVHASHFTGNSAQIGGALYVAGTSATAMQVLTASVFTGNQATDSSGGAIDDDAGDLSMMGDTFYRNTASGSGGALYYGSTSGLDMVNDTLDSNLAASGGGI